MEDHATNRNDIRQLGQRLIGGETRFRSGPRRLLPITLVLLATLTSCLNNSTQQTGLSSDGGQEEFDLSSRKWESSGESAYFILAPGYQVTLKSSLKRLSFA